MPRVASILFQLPPSQPPLPPFPACALPPLYHTAHARQRPAGGLCQASLKVLALIGRFCVNPILKRGVRVDPLGQAEAPLPPS